MCNQRRKRKQPVLRGGVSLYGDDESAGVPVIRTIPDLMYAISIARTQEDRLGVYMRAAYLGMVQRIPADWNPNGTLKLREVK